MRVRRRVGLVLVVLIGCSDPPAGDDDDTGPTEDAGVDAGDAGPVVEPPAAPNFEPCPAGWRPVEDDGVVTCDPWGEGGPEDCADDEAQFPGDPGCAPLGSACSDDDEWASDLPDASVLYVSVNAGELRNGSRVRPFGTLAEAIAVARDGNVIALGKGTFVQTVYLPAGVTLWGACVTETRVDSTGPLGELGTLMTDAPGIVIKNLTLSGNRTPLWIQGSAASVDLQDVAIVDARDTGVEVIGGGYLGVESVAIRRIGESADGHYGWGIGAEDGAQVVAHRLFVEDCDRHGVFASEEDTSVELSDVAVLHSVGVDGMSGEGIAARLGAALRVERAYLDDNLAVGLTVVYGASASVSDVIVRRTRMRVEGVSGFGISVVGDGATFEGERIVLDENHESALAVGDATATITDIVMQRTQVTAEGYYGRGVNLSVQAHLDMTRAVLRDLHDLGLVAFHEGTVATLVDVDVLDVLPRECCAEFTAGIGVGAALGGSIDARRFRITRSALAGVQIVSEGQVDLRDGEVSESPIGINIQVPGYDMTRVTDHVAYRDNGENLQSLDLPVPEPVVPESLDE